MTSNSDEYMSIKFDATKYDKFTNQDIEYHFSEYWNKPFLKDSTKFIKSEETIDDLFEITKKTFKTITNIMLDKKHKNGFCVGYDNLPRINDNLKELKINIDDKDLLYRHIVPTQLKTDLNLYDQIIDAKTPRDIISAIFNSKNNY